jgi:uncharacterized cupin superfamily protein
MQVTKTSTMNWEEGINQGPYQSRRKNLGGQKLPCGLWELPPGAKSFPLHVHHVTEEAMFVISGHVTLRTEEGKQRLEAGDFVSFPPGGPAHQLINEETEPCIFIAMSATLGVDVVEYPDSDKVSSSLGVWPNVKRFIFKRSDQKPYFDGEL